MGQVFARTFATLGMGAGVGFLTWGIASVVLSEPVQTPHGIGSWILVISSSEAMGWGAGLLTAGIAALGFSLLAANSERSSKD